MAGGLSIKLSLLATCADASPGTDDATHHKHGFLHSGMGSRLVILDPELCKSTPGYHWLSTGIRGVDHCIESLCSSNATLQSDENAEKGLRLLAPSLLRCKNDPNDIEVSNGIPTWQMLADDAARRSKDAN